MCYKISCFSLVIYWSTNQQPKLKQLMQCNAIAIASHQIFHSGTHLASPFLHSELMANTLCPIELEPRTLNQVQLTQAREVAAEVAQKLEPCEASALFIEGLMHPIQKVMQMEENENLTEKLADCMKKAESITDQSKACHCQCSCATENSFKEPLSAPF